MTTTPNATTAPAPLSAEREREIRALLDRRNYSMGLAARYAIEDLLAAVNDLTRERDTAHRRVLQFTGAPTVDEAFAILIAPVEWDALASYHGVTIIGNTPTDAMVERAAEALRKADPDWFASPDFRRSVAHTVLTAALGGDHE